MMSGSGSLAWVSYGYYDKDTHANTFPNMKLNYEKDFENSKSSAKPHFPASRVEKQRQRVFDASVRRMMLQRAQNQRELLQDLNVDSIGGTLRKELLFNDFNDVAAYYDQTKGSQQESKRMSRTARPDSGISIASEIRRINSGQQRGMRPRSAVSRRQRSTVFPDPEERVDDVTTTTPRKSRVQSAPTSRSKSSSVQMVSKSTQDYSCVVECEKKQTRSGCLCCPAECRPVSSSTFNQLSSTGLQATDGPNHYQYFHFDKYLRYQRPHSAIGERLDYLEATGRKRSIPVQFTNIVRSCSIFERSNSDLHSPRSRTPRQAWTDSSQDNFGMVITSMMVKKPDKYSRRRKGSSDSGRGSDDQGYRSSYERELKEESETADEDDMLNDDVRQQAERSYAMASSDDVKVRDLPTDRPTIVVDIRESVMPKTLKPLPSRPKPPTQDVEDTGRISPLDEPAQILPPPAPKYSTDMLTGRVHHHEREMTVLPSSSEDTIKEDVPPPIHVAVEIPDPLPIKRVPHPKVHTVNIVAPREELKISDSDFEKEEDVSPDFLTDRTGTYSSESESGLDDFKDSTDKPPASILKSASQDFSKEKREHSSKVKFDIPPTNSEDKVDREEDAASFVVSSFATNKEEKPEEEETTDVIEESTEASEIEEIEEEDAEEEEPADVGVKQVILRQTDKTTDKTVIHVTKSALIKTPSTKEHQKQPDKPLYEEPEDEELKRLLAPPDLIGFDTPVFAPTSKKKKVKKGKKGASTGKKKKGKKKKKKTTEPKPEPPAEPLFTYEPRSPSAMDVAKNRLAAMKQENADLIDVMAAVSRFDRDCHERMRSQPWLFGRMALSKQICRFWLPMDLRDLEGLSPSDYLSQYCAVCKRRQKLYSATFERQLMKRKVTKEVQTEIMKKTLVPQEVGKAIRTLHADCIEEQHIARVFQLVCIGLEHKRCSVSRVDSKLFSAICAFTERLFYGNFVTEDAAETESSNRHRIESADFDGLEWRLEKVKISEDLRTLLFTL